jgi:hypothetical protein
VNSIKTVYKIFVFTVLVFVSANLYSQEPAIDSLQYNISKPDSVKVHSPKRAAIYSAVLPGLGQAYNKKYWKIPLVYVGFGTIGYFIGWNNRNYNTYKIAYRDLTDSDPATDSYLDIEGSQYYDLDDPTEYENFKSGLYKGQESFRRNRDLLIISIVGFYGLNIIDASVDAHFFDFDISEDLTMNWQPTVQPYEKQLVYGLNFTFNF